MTYKSLKRRYDDFDRPLVEIKVSGNSLGDAKRAFGISNVEIDLTAGFEASTASFSIYNAYDYDDAQFDFNSIKNYVLIGSPVQIYMGYNITLTEVFRGVITRVTFLIEDGDAPCVQVSAMDVKAVMMANRYHKALTATDYSGAVKEIFEQGVYNSLKNDEVIVSLEISDTPDVPLVPSSNPNEETDKMIEMVGESDYEFVTRAAKKFNYEFFVLGGRVYFRKAKVDSTSQITIDQEAAIKRLSVEYDLTGLTESVEVRGLDVGKAKLLSDTKKNSNKLSQGNKAKSLISGSKFVYIDPSVASAEDAGYRANYLLEDMMYRYGSLDLELIGIPEIIPGRFINVKNIGTAISNEFYVYGVRHTMNREGEFITRVTGKAAKQGSSLLAL